MKVNKRTDRTRQIMFYTTDYLMDKLSEYQHDRRMESRTEAINAILEKELKETGYLK